jgi:hypothetical protein
MTFSDFSIPALAFLLGIVAAYLFFRQQISAIEGRAQTISNAGSPNAQAISGRTLSTARVQR